MENGCPLEPSPDPTLLHLRTDARCRTRRFGCSSLALERRDVHFDALALVQLELGVGVCFFASTREWTTRHAKQSQIGRSKMRLDGS
jgi:hypothetical protein